MVRAAAAADDADVRIALEERAVLRAELRWFAGVELADMLSAVVDGGIILSKTVSDTSMLPRQVLLYREFVRCVFMGPGAASEPRPAADTARESAD